MEKKLFTSKISFLAFKTISFFNLSSCCLIICLFQSCAPTIQCSTDFIRNGYVGPSYDNIESDLLFGLNAGIITYVEQNRSASSTTRMLIPNTFEVNNSSYPSFYPSSTPEKQKGFDVKNLVIRTGIALIGKGGKVTVGTETDVTRLTYLQVPIYGVYKHQLAEKGTLYGGLGPYFAYGLGGTVKVTDTGKTTEFAAFDENGGGFKRFDAGLGIMAGYRLPNDLEFNLEYQLGLTNMNIGGGSDKITNRVLSLNVGYPLEKIIGAIKKK
jgi:Outer membrane protein beta-barrel domain